MTEPSPSTAPEEPRDFINYTCFHIDPAWRRKLGPERTSGADRFVELLERPPEPLIARTYSLVGTKAGVEMMLWTIAPRLEAIQEFHARLAGTPIGGYLERVYSYLGMARRSEYLGEHAHGGQEGTTTRRRPFDLPYLFVYPFVKRRDWYALPFEERRRIMGEHFRIGHRFPRVQIHTGYSVGLDDAEFILAFEAESPAEFLDLVEALRPSEASRYTQLETPIFTGVKVTARRMVELAEGLP